MPIRSPRLWLWCTASVAFSLVGCKSADQQRREADREVYAILDQRRAELGVDQTAFSIEPPPDSLRQRMLEGYVHGRLNLLEVLEVAADNSRDYQRRKEDLYLSALDLTLERFRFQVQRNGNVAALLAGDVEDGAGPVSVGGTAGFTKLLGTGAAIMGDLGLSLARDLSSGDGWDLTSTFALSITQPLLRGFGERIVKEPLTQAERNVIYAVRDFERFRRTFAVDTCSRYFRVLQQSDTASNERANMDNLELLRQRNEALANAGRLSDIQVDQARQDELGSKNRLIVADQRLQTQLDDFKFFLGLPILEGLDLDPGVLDRLDTVSIPQVTEERAIEVALERRLDYQTALDTVDDLERRVAIAEDNLRSALDVTLRTAGTSADGRAIDYDPKDLSWVLSAQLDLPIDNLAERNNYRESLINLDRARRNAEQLADQIQADLRDSLRLAASQLESLVIQRGAVTLAERRVESTTLNLQAGRAATRDILEAQESLRTARNSLTAARIDYYLSQLALWRDMELLTVDEIGVRPDPTVLAPVP